VYGVGGGVHDLGWGIIVVGGAFVGYGAVWVLRHGVGWSND